MKPCHVVTVSHLLAGLCCAVSRVCPAPHLTPSHPRSRAVKIGAASVLQTRFHAGQLHLLGTSLKIGHQTPGSGTPALPAVDKRPAVKPTRQVPCCHQPTRHGCSTQHSSTHGTAQDTTCIQPCHSSHLLPKSLLATLINSEQGCPGGPPSSSSCTTGCPEQHPGQHLLLY